jgi:hypothetical protein
MATTQNALLRGPVSRVFFFVLLLMQCWTGGYLMAQVDLAIEEGVAIAGDSIEVKVMGHVKYLDPIQDTAFSPHVRFLYLFGDGNFINGTKDSIQKYLYPSTMPDGTSAGFFDARVYLTPIYSGGKPPPKRAAFLSPTNLSTAPPKTKSVVDSLRNIYLQRNQDISKEDPMVNIVSFKNTTNDTLYGKIFLFFNDSIAVEEKLGDGTAKRIPIDKAQFSLADRMKFSNRVRQETFLFNGLGKPFDNVVVMKYERLAPGEEVHLFFEMAHDPAMFNLFTGEKKTVTNFLAVMTSSTGNIRPPALTEEETNFLSKFDFGEILSALSPNTLDTILGTQINSLDLLGSLSEENIVDISLMTTSLVKAHDPNQVIAEACACKDKSGVQKVVITVDCENDGTAPTEIVIIEVFIPSQLDFNSIAATPISYLPALSLTGPRSITMTKDAARRSITWTMKGFHLMGTQVVGFGHPLSQGQIVFTALTNAGVALSAIDSIHACIRFSETAGPKDIVCTPKAAVQPIWDGPDTQGQLECVDDCKCPPWKLPRWLLYVLVALILLIALIRWWRNNNP